MMNRLRPTTNTGPKQTESFTGRKRVTLLPGHSLMDWIRLGRTHNDLSGVGSHKVDITAGQLAVHNTQKDLWMAIRGKVYNLTPYLDYHPGGIDELMRAAGKDGTELFDEIHNWVNVESMLEKCLIGNLVEDATSKAPGVVTLRSRSIGVCETLRGCPQRILLICHRELDFEPDDMYTDETELQEQSEGDDSSSDDDDDDDSDVSGSTTSIKLPTTVPTHDWYQNKTDVVVVIYTRWADMRDDLVIVDCKKEELIIEVFITDNTFFIHMKPSHRLLPDCKVKVFPIGKVEVTFKKEDSSVTWATLGTPLREHEGFHRTKSIDCRYRTWTVISNTVVTHDTRLLCFKAPPECRMVVPIGYHVHIKSKITGMEIARSYTVVAPTLLKPYVSNGKMLYLMIKSYKGGVISPWITSLKQGDKVMMSNFDGNFDQKRLERSSHLIMFAAGTGFTVMIRIIIYCLFNLNKATFPLKLVFYNKSEKDILWREELDQLAKKFSRFSVTHVLSQETDVNWKGLRGRVAMEHVKEFVPTPTETPNPLFLICGQWAYNDAVESFARLNGLQDEHIHIFAN